MEAKLAEEEILGDRLKKEPPKLTTPYVTKTLSYTPGQAHTKKNWCNAHFIIVQYEWFAVILALLQWSTLKVHSGRLQCLPVSLQEEQLMPFMRIHMMRWDLLYLTEGAKISCGNLVRGRGATLKK